MESWDRERRRRTLLFKTAERRKCRDADRPLKTAIGSITCQGGPEKRKNKATSQPNSWKVILAKRRRYHTDVITSVHRSQTGGELVVPLRHRLGSSIWDLVKRDTSRLFLLWRWKEDNGISILHSHSI